VTLNQASSQKALMEMQSSEQILFGRCAVSELKQNRNLQPIQSDCSACAQYVKRIKSSLKVSWPANIKTDFTRPLTPHTAPAQMGRGTSLCRQSKLNFLRATSLRHRIQKEALRSARTNAHKKFQSKGSDRSGGQPN
jgi:hypothetical protein